MRSHATWLVMAWFLAAPLAAEEDDAKPDEELAAPQKPQRKRAKPPDDKPRLRYTIEGLISFFEGPEGSFGESTGMPDQLLWNELHDGEARAYTSALSYAYLWMMLR